MPDKPIIFVSCGQASPDEKKLGKDICQLIKDNTQYEPYFAETVTSLDGLTHNIFDKLNAAAGFIFVMHLRGNVDCIDYNIARASVWVEQELAIASFLQQIMRRKCFVAAFTQQGLHLEGVRKYILMNPHQFNTSDDVLSYLAGILPDWHMDRSDDAPIDAAALLSDSWFIDHSEHARNILADSKISGFMEVRCVYDNMELPLLSGIDLRSKVHHSQYNQSGWPFGIFDNSGDYLPRTIRGGFVSEVIRDTKSVDYSAYDSRGRIYLFRNLFENYTYEPNVVVGSIRIKQTVEAVLFCLRLLKMLGASDERVSNISIRHAGYRGFQYRRNIGQAWGHSNIIADDDSNGTLSQSISKYFVENVGSLSPEPFITLTRDLFMSCDLQGIPDRVFYEKCISSFLSK